MERIKKVGNCVLSETYFNFESAYHTKDCRCFAVTGARWLARGRVTGDFVTLAPPPLCDFHPLAMPATLA
jgi:hypothetical protein